MFQNPDNRKIPMIRRITHHSEKKIVRSNKELDAVPRATIEKRDSILGEPRYTSTPALVPFSPAGPDFCSERTHAYTYACTRATATRAWPKTRALARREPSTGGRRWNATKGGKTVTRAYLQRQTTRNVAEQPHGSPSRRRLRDSVDRGKHTQFRRTGSMQSN